MMKRRLKRVFLTACSILAAGSLFLLLWLYGAFLPRWIAWEEKSVRAEFCEPRSAREDAAKSGSASAKISAVAELRNRRVRITKEDGAGITAVFTSRALWRVSDVYAADLDGDGSDEVIFLVWKHGSYGSSRPFWAKGRDISFSQHVFIYRYKNGELAPYWMSSALGIQVTTAMMDEEARLHLTDTAGTETIWAWQGWGLKLVGERRPDGGSSPDPSLTGNAAPEPDTDPGCGELTLLAVGDNLAHESVCAQSYDKASGTFDFARIYDSARSVISSYDIAVVNQETIFVNNPPQVSGFPLFGTPAAMGDALAGAGFDVVLAATNHANDKGEQGLKDTLSFWKTQHPEILLLGLNESQEDSDTIDYLERNGIRLALFNYTEHLNGRVLPDGKPYQVNTLTSRGAAVSSAKDPSGTAVYINKEKLLQDLCTVEGNADLSLCFLHIGEEYSTQPSLRQRALCEELIDAGADLIICSHAHILQPFGLVRTAAGHEGVVYWSLGNFMSHQTRPGTDSGGAADIFICKIPDSASRASASSSEVLKDSAGEYFLQSHSFDGSAILVRCRLRNTHCQFGNGNTAVYID